MKKILVCGGQVVENEHCLKTFTKNGLCPLASRDDDGSTDICRGLAIEYLPAAPVARLVEAAKEYRNCDFDPEDARWNDIEKKFDEALAAVEEAMEEKGEEKP